MKIEKKLKKITEVKKMNKNEKDSGQFAIKPF